MAAAFLTQEEQRKILLSLLQDEDGKQWAENRQGWDKNSNQSVCSWDGIVCDDVDDSETKNGEGGKNENDKDRTNNNTQGGSDDNGGDDVDDNRHRQVISIELGGTDLLLSSIPTELGLLTSLETIDLERNLIFGFLPTEIISLPKLRRLKLGSNQLNGRLWTSSSSSASSQATSGPLFSETLEELDLSFNNFEGSLPPDFMGRNMALQFLDLRHNQFTGTLPSGWKKKKKQQNDDASSSSSSSSSSLLFPHLSTLSLTHNRFTGTIPPFVGTDLPELQYLFLNHNRFVGTIPTDWNSTSSASISNTDVDDVSTRNETNETTKNTNGTSSSSSSFGGGGGSSKLREIWLHHNWLSGTVPPSLATALGELENLYIDGNKLTGTIPQALCDRNLNGDFVHAQATKGAVDSISGLRSSNSSSDGSNSAPPPSSCGDIACPVGTMSSEGVLPCDVMCDDAIPYLGRNGARCPSLTELDIVQQLLLSSSSSSSSADGSHRFPSSKVEGEEDGHDGDDEHGDDPNRPHHVTAARTTACDYKRVVCDGKGRVVMIDASRAGLGGPIPETLGFLPHLEILDLSDNDLTGYLPSDLRLASNLRYVDVSGNRLRGIVPPLLCRKSGLNRAVDIDQDRTVGVGVGGGSPTAAPTMIVDTINDIDDEEEEHAANCALVSCPVGTYSQVGYGDDCKPCTTAVYLGSKTCPPTPPPPTPPGSDGGEGDRQNPPGGTAGGGSPTNYRHDVNHAGLLAFAAVTAAVLLFTIAFFCCLQTYLQTYPPLGRRPRRRHYGRGRRQGQQQHHHQNKHSNAHDEPRFVSEDEVEDDTAPLPHIEEVKTRISLLDRIHRQQQKRTAQRSRMGSRWNDDDEDHHHPHEGWGPPSRLTFWFRNKIRSARGYWISLRETSPAKRVPGEPSNSKVSEGYLDDFGWRERDSILKRRDLDGVFNESPTSTSPMTIEQQQHHQQQSHQQHQQQLLNSSQHSASTSGAPAPVWEYPDPLEQDALTMMSPFPQDAIITTTNRSTPPHQHHQQQLHNNNNVDNKNDDLSLMDVGNGVPPPAGNFQDRRFSIDDDEELWDTPVGGGRSTPTPTISSSITTISSNHNDSHHQQQQQQPTNHNEPYDNRSELFLDVPRIE